MCNHYRLASEALESWSEAHEFEPSNFGEDVATDIWPKRNAWVGRVQANDRVMDQMAWGVPITLPGKRQGTHVTKHVTNVRNLASPFWKSTLANPVQRCLVPFSRFAEPKPGKDEATGRPAEHWFALRDAQAAAFAGIWRRVEDRNVFAFLTCAPNSVVEPYHAKAMPVILLAEDYERWLTGTYDEVIKLQSPFPSQLMALMPN